MTNSLSASVSGSEIPANGSHPTPTRAGLWGLTIGSIGVVYGDIGTSPLYAVRVALEAASGPDHAGIARATVIGVLSLILWALIIVGTLTLMALASRAVGHVGKAMGVVTLLGIASAGLFYGDAVITPALSVLSAVEGIDVASPALHEYIVPLTVVILVIL